MRKIVVMPVYEDLEASSKLSIPFEKYRFNSSIQQLGDRFIGELNPR